MTDGPQSSAVRGVRRGLLLAGGAGLTDGRLLDLFLARRDDDAFEAIVRRHGPMVLGVCRRIARHRQDAEDAFQATFLVLARKAGSVQPREQVGNWLYGVACRAAMKARANAMRRISRERPTGDVPEPEAPREAPEDDRLAALDRELGRLPDLFRLPLILCDLEGRGRKEVAAQLGIPEGTLSSRLTAARNKLADRLRVGNAGAALATARAEAGPVPEALVAALRGAADGVSISAVGLAAELVGAGALSRLKVGSALLVGVLATAVLALTPRPAGEPLKPSAAPGRAAAAPKPAPGGLREQLESTDWLLSEVSHENGTLLVTDQRDGIAGRPLTVIAGAGGFRPTGFSLSGLPVDPAAAVELDGRPIRFRDLRPEARVRLRLAPGRLAVTRIDATSPKPPSFGYVLARVDPARKTVTVLVKETGRTLEALPVSPAAVIEVLPTSDPPLARFRAGSWADLKAGMSAQLELHVAESGAVEVRRVRVGE